jgi:diaminohydroxyphosphoribosylaminopyrimidine deaminase/5-amino-6-(5-phosphoribosylamino)uracil reductase
VATQDAQAQQHAAEDRAWMARALELAERGRGSTSPNPLVGAVLVRDGRLLAEGFHRARGEPHAEALALAAAGPAALGATCYVTLEPCAHQGLTPPCADALVAARVARVVTAIGDPDPRVAGAGLARLRAAGIPVTAGVGADAAARQNAAYLIHRRLGRPRITLKLAASLDGKVAAADGTSRWITGEAARADAQRLRAEADAVAVGAGTALADDPRLTVRLPGFRGRQPLRLLLDAAGRVEPRGHLFDGAAPTLVATTEAAPAALRDRWRRHGAEVLVCPARDGGVDLAVLAAALGERGVLELMVEGGPRLHASLWAAGLADRLVWYLAPLVIGGAAAPGMLDGAGAPTLAAARRVHLDSVERIGDDLRVIATPDGSGEPRRGAPENQVLSAQEA